MEFEFVCLAKYLSFERVEYPVDELLAYLNPYDDRLLVKLFYFLRSRQKAETVSSFFLKTFVKVYTRRLCLTFVICVYSRAIM